MTNKKRLYFILAGWASILFVCALRVLGAFPVNSNSYTATVSTTTSPSVWTNFNWNWNNYDDQTVSATFNGFTGASNIMFRVGDGSTYWLEVLNGTFADDGTNTTFSFNVSHTNLPPEGSYLAEFIATDDGTNYFKTLAKGKLKINYSLFSSTNQTDYTPVSILYSYAGSNPSNFISQAIADSLYYGISNPSNFISQAIADSLYYGISNPSNYVSQSALGSAAYSSSNNFYLATNPSNYIDSASVSNLVSGSQIMLATLYGWGSATSTVSGAKMLKREIPTNTYTSITSTGVTNNQYIASYYTEVGQRITSVSEGTATLRFHAYKGAAGVATITAELYITDSNGVKVAEYDGTNPTAALGTSDLEYDVAIPIPSNTTVSSTQRLGVRLRANVTSGSPTIYTSSEGSRNMILSLPVPSAMYATEDELAAVQSTADLAYAYATNLTVECAGTPYNDWWFNAIAQVEYGGTTNSTVVSTNQDAQITSYIQASGQTSFRVAPNIVRATSPETITTSVSPAGVATYADGLVSYVSSGTATLTMASTSRTYTTNLTLTATASTNAVWTAGMSGSARAAAIAAVDPNLSGTTNALYSTQDHATATYVRNTNCWAAGSVQALTCASPWNSTYANLRAGTLISPRHILFANHYPLANGSTLRFVTTNNVVVTRTLSSQAQVDGTDLRVGLLDSDVPATISFAKVLPDNYATYFPNGIWRIPLAALDQQEKAIVVDGGTNTETETTILIPQIAERKAQWEGLISGDSGNPLLMLIGSDAVILTTWTSSVYGPSVTGYKSLINSTMTALGGGYTLTDVDLSSYTEY